VLVLVLVLVLLLRLEHEVRAGLGLVLLQLLQHRRQQGCVQIWERRSRRSLTLALLCRHCQRNLLRLPHDVRLVGLAVVRAMVECAWSGGKDRRRRCEHPAGLLRGCRSWCACDQRLHAGDRSEAPELWRGAGAGAGCGWRGERGLREG
jgi:hypothetical protein